MVSKWRLDMNGVQPRCIQMGMGTCFAGSAPVRCQRIEGQGGGSDRREIAVDVDDHIGGVGGIHADSPAGSCRYDRGLGFDASIPGLTSSRSTTTSMV